MAQPVVLILLFGGERGIARGAYLVEYPVHAFLLLALPQVVVVVVLPCGGVAGVAGLSAAGCGAQAVPPALQPLAEGGRGGLRVCPSAIHLAGCLPAASPVAQAEPPEEHAAEVGEVGHVVVGAISREELNGGVGYDEVLGLHRDGRDEQHDALIGEEHAEG